MPIVFETTYNLMTTLFLSDNLHSWRPLIRIARDDAFAQRARNCSAGAIVGIDGSLDHGIRSMRGAGEQG